MNPSSPWHSFTTPRTSVSSAEIWTLPARSIVGCLFGIVVLVGVFGNSLVVAAITRQRRLHTRGNYLIGSLAVADLLVCLVVVPYSALLTLREFGPRSILNHWKPPIVACQTLIFVDVACCTASILHLCAIACDRYVTITTLRFQTTTTFLRVLPVIAGIWLASAILPTVPYLLLQQSAMKDNELLPEDQNQNLTVTSTTSSSIASSSSTSYSASSTESLGNVSPVDGLSCVVNTNKVYRLVATTLAFYVPLVLILVIYWRVSQIAWERVHVKQSEKSGLRGALALTHSIDRSLSHIGASMNSLRPSTNLSVREPSLAAMDNGQGRSTPHAFCLFSQKISWCCSTNNLSEKQSEKDIVGADSCQDTKKGSEKRTSKNDAIVVPEIVIGCHGSDDNLPRSEASRKKVKESSDETISSFSEAVASSRQESNPLIATDEHQQQARRTMSGSVLSHSGNIHNVSHKCAELELPSTGVAVSSQQKKGAIARQQARIQLKLRRERKIIRTMGMVVGAFVICWLPFFLKDLILPFCDSCFLPTSAEVFINWLGYANSALNPFIYGFTNEEFSKAFKKVCREATNFIFCKFKGSVR